MYNALNAMDTLCVEAPEEKSAGAPFIIVLLLSNLVSHLNVVP